MNKILLIMAFTGILTAGTAQNNKWDVLIPGYKYIVLTNPTERNLSIIDFLTENRIFKTDLKKTKFLCVYHSGQSYDFSQSRDYIATKTPGKFTLVEIDGHLTTEDAFKTNSCTEDFKTIFNHSKGVFFFGGPDIQPEIYGEENLGSVVTDPGRHLFEVSFLYHLTGSEKHQGVKPFLEENPDYLVTGFCLGLQSMNVAAGGTLYQDIPTQVYHKNGPRETLETDRENLHRNYWQEISDDKQLMGINLHTVRFTDHPFFGKSVRINRNFHPAIYSSHHQSMKEIGTGFEITALSPDGKIIEGLVHSKYRYVFGVQFHPEVPALYEDQESWKFAPGDEAATYHRLIGKESVKFHRKYWAYISKCLH